MSKAKLFVIVTVLAIGSSLLAACSGSGNDTSSNMERPAEPRAQGNEVLTPNPIPNTGETVAKSVPADTETMRRWSGEIFLSDNDYPDLMQQTTSQQEQDAETACISFEDDNSPRRHGGCAE